jgi:class 3 adenylate cyclase
MFGWRGRRRVSFVDSFLIAPRVALRPLLLWSGGINDTAFTLPTGTVTFLLTDVEASTRSWERAPDEMGAAVARHYELLAGAVARWGGVRPVEQGEGDSIVAVFSRGLGRGGGGDRRATGVVGGVVAPDGVDGGEDRGAPARHSCEMKATTWVRR